MQTFKGYIVEQKEFENLILELNDQEFDALVETLDYDPSEGQNWNWEDYE